jgi:hypothetical protein
VVSNTYGRLHTATKQVCIHGDAFIGQWKDGEIGPMATRTTASGRAPEYSGEFNDDNEENGRGLFTSANDEKYGKMAEGMATRSFLGPNGEK